MKAESQNIPTRVRLDKPWQALYQAWNIFRKRAFTFLGITLSPFFVLLFTGIFSSFLAGFTRNIPFLMVILFFTFLGLLLAAFLFLWSQVSLIIAISDEKINTKEAYKKSKGMILEYVILSLLSFLVVIGGTALLIIPGIILSIYFSFSIFIFVGEGERRFNALSKSFNYIKGYWWSILKRTIFIILVFLIPALIIILISQIIGLSQEDSKMAINVLLVIFAPIATIYYYLIYNNLKSLKSSIDTDKANDKKSLFVGFIVFGVIAMMIIIGLVIANPYHLK